MFLPRGVFHMEFYFFSFSPPPKMGFFLVFFFLDPGWERLSKRFFLKFVFGEGGGGGFARNCWGMKGGCRLFVSKGAEGGGG